MNIYILFKGGNWVNKSKQGTIYFLIIMLLQLFLPVYLIIEKFNISDIRLILFINHTIIFILPAIIYLIITKQSAKRVLRLNKLYFKDMLLVVALGFVCQPIMTFFSLISQFFFENEVGNFMGAIINTPYWILLLLVAVLPAITEEITIRGIVLASYDNVNIYIACLASGLLFGIMHLDPQQFLYATALGFILALVVRLTNSIFAASIMHFIINGTSITLQKIISYFPVDNSEVSIAALGIGEKISYAITYGLIALVFSGIVYIIIKKLKNNNIRRGVLETEVIYRAKSNENIFNIPFIAIIVIYILTIVLQFIL